jgi:DNA-directed RNA polymerase subunit K
MVENKEFSKYERARIIGARGLQISMDAPLLVDMKENDLDAVNYDPLKIAERELDSGVLPISVNRPMPEKKEENIEKLKIEESKISDAAKEAAEKAEEREIAEGGEMMELADSGEESEVDESVTEEKAEEGME